MAKIILNRVDNRLIHGQVTANWVRSLAIDTIVLIDDSIPEDKFLRQVLQMSIPQGRKLLIFSPEDAIGEWKKDNFGLGRAMIVFKNIAGAYASFKKGLPIDHLQIGGVEHAAGRKMVLESIALSDEEALTLNEFEKMGTEVYFQIVSEYKPVQWEKIRKKSFPHLDTAELNR